jgi:FHA domain
VAILRSSSGSTLIPCRCLVGRSRLADLILEGRRASNEHASIGWYAGKWFMRDLGSSNGTMVDGKLLGGKERVVLSAGTILQFGSEADAWEVVDVAAPAPCAVRLGPQRYVWGKGALLVLPDELAPEASIFFNRGAWKVDNGGVASSPDCGDIIELPGGHWRLLLPDDPDDSAFTAGYELDLSKLEITFQLSSDSVIVYLSQGSKEVRLPARACLQTLLLLAQIRERGAASDGGWIKTAELAAMRSCGPEKINVDVHRLRKLFEEAGVNEAARIIERDDTKKLRIGVEQTRQVRM